MKLYLLFPSSLSLSEFGMQYFFKKRNKYNGFQLISSFWRQNKLTLIQMSPFRAHEALHRSIFLEDGFS